MSVSNTKVTKIFFCRYCVRKCVHALPSKIYVKFIICIFLCATTKSIKCDEKGIKALAARKELHQTRSDMGQA